jgi:transcriptional regulator of heat shock response
MQKEESPAGILCRRSALQDISNLLNSEADNYAFKPLRHSMIEEKVKIKCTKCAQVFRERAQKVRDGFQTNCRHCNRLITFDATSEDRNIRRALTNAKEVRFMLEMARRTNPTSAPAVEPIGIGRN